MIVFWLLVAFLSGTAVAALVVPMLRASAGSLEADPERRLGVLRHRRREIEDERASGRLTHADAEQAIDQLAGEAASDLAAAGPAAAGPGGAGSPPWALAAVLALAIPVLAVVGYLHWGTPALVAGLPDPGTRQISPDDIRQALEALNRRVREQPDDAEAWTLLAQARRLDGDLEGSIQAFAESSRLQPRNARILAELAETIAASREGDFSGRPEQLLEQALQIAPDDAKALALMGAAQYRLGRPARALEFLNALLAQMDPQSEQSRQIREVATRIAGEAGLAPPSAGAPSVAAAPSIGTPSTAPSITAPATATATPSTAAPAAGTPPADSTATATATGSGSGSGSGSESGSRSGSAAGGATTAAAVIRGHIRLAPKLADALPPGATLFISARAAEGPRMPVAALRRPAAALADGRRLDFALSDAQVLDRQRLLSTTGSIVVEARVSASGDAIRAAGDLLGASPPVAPGATVDLVIDQVVR